MLGVVLLVVLTLLFVVVVLLVVLVVVWQEPAPAVRYVMPALAHAGHLMHAFEDIVAAHSNSLVGHGLHAYLCRCSAR